MDRPSLSHAAEILLVEDSPSDVRLTQEALKEGKIQANLRVVDDGIEALKFLRKEDPYQDVPRPDLILLDLNLPRKDGRETLAEIKRDDNLKTIPVVVLTTSEAEEDIVRTYKMHANCYVTKPVDFDQFSRIVRQIQDFWFVVVKLPGRGV